VDTVCGYSGREVTECRLYAGQKNGALRTNKNPADEATIVLQRSTKTIKLYSMSTFYTVLLSVIFNTGGGGVQQRFDFFTNIH
jgi:hypothetical protein